MITRLMCEELETRAVPADFSWDPVAIPVGGFYSWSDPQNWDGPVGEIPNSANANVYFTGLLSSKNVKFDVAGGVTIGELIVENDYSGMIRLDNTLAIKGGEISSDDATLAPSTNATQLIIESGNFKVRAGQIGNLNQNQNNGARSAIQVKGKLEFDLASDVYIGMNIDVGNGGSAGVVDILGENDLWMANSAKITLSNPGSSLNLLGRNGEANIKASELGGDSIQVEAGTVLRNGVGDLGIALPIRLNGSQSELVIKNDQAAHNEAGQQIPNGLTIVSPGSASTGMYSLLVKDGASVSLGSAQDNWNNTPGIGVDGNIVFDGGKLHAFGKHPSIMAASVNFTGGSAINLGNSNKNQFTDLIFQMHSDVGKVFMPDVIWNIHVKAGTEFSDTITVINGSLSLLNNTSSINITNVSGTLSEDDGFAVVFADWGIDELFADFNKRDLLPDSIDVGIYWLGGGSDGGDDDPVPVPGTPDSTPIIP